MDKETQGTDDLQEVENPQEVEETKELDETEKEEKHEPKEGTKRWNEIYYKAKEGERRVKELESDIAAMRKHNSELMDVVKTTTTTKKEEAQKNDESSKLAELKTKKREALKDMDLVTADEIQEQIDELKERARSQPQPQDVKKVVKETVLETEQEKELRAFIKECPWYDESSDRFDPAMAGAANVIGEILIKKEGYKGTHASFLGEVKKRVEERFGYGKQPKVKTPAVEGVGSLVTTVSNNQKVELSDDQKRVARLMFPDDPEGEKRYIKQLEIIQKGKNK